MNLSKLCISYEFRIRERILNTNSLYLPKFKYKECCNKVQYELVEMHTNPLLYEFSKLCISFKFRIRERIRNTNSLYLPKFKYKECCNKVQYELVEMHTNPLYPQLICIVA